MEEVQNQVLEEEAKGSTTTMEKVYIAVGNDLQEGFKTIDWALKKWNNIPISIVLLHLCNISQDFVYTPCTISSFSILTSSFLFSIKEPPIYTCVVSPPQLGSFQRVLWARRSFKYSESTRTKRSTSCCLNTSLFVKRFNLFSFCYNSVIFLCFFFLFLMLF